MHRMIVAAVSWRPENKQTQTATRANEQTSAAFGRNRRRSPSGKHTQGRGRFFAGLGFERAERHRMRCGRQGYAQASGALTVRRARHGGRRTMAAWRRGSNGARHDSQRLPAAARVGCKHAETCVLLSRRRFGADVPRRPLCLRSRLPAGPRTAQARCPTCTCGISHLLPAGRRTAPRAFARLPPARACRGRSGTRGRERCSTVSAVAAGAGGQ